MGFYLAIVLVAGLVAADAAEGQFYRYTDAHGSVRFTDDINRVPEKQRSSARQYATPLESQSVSDELPAGSSGLPGGNPDPPRADGPASDSGSHDGAGLEAAKQRIGDLKKKLDADYQTLLREREALAREKEAPKTRAEISRFNERVEGFNRRAAEFESQGGELRRLTDEFNRRVIEENARASKSPAPAVKP